MLTLEGLIGVISLVLTAFGVGYAIGKDRDGSNSESKTQKQPPVSQQNMTAIFSQNFVMGYPSAGGTLFICFNSTIAYIDCQTSSLYVRAANVSENLLS